VRGVLNLSGRTKPRGGDGSLTLGKGKKENVAPREYDSLSGGFVEGLIEIIFRKTLSRSLQSCGEKERKTCTRKRSLLPS